MTDTIRRISWRDLFPWLILLRSFRIAVSPPLLALATVVVLIAPLGWRLAAIVFQPKAIELRGIPESVPADVPRALEAQVRQRQPAAPTAGRSLILQWLPPAVREYLPGAPTAILEAYAELAEPLARLFQMQTTARETAYYAFGFLWTLLLWSFPGAVITRQAVVRLATDAPPGWLESVQFARRRWLSYFLAPLCPLVVLLTLAIVIAFVGLPIRWFPAAGALLAGLCWIFVALAGLGALWLFGGLLFGFPLMWPTIGAERDGDPFEAFSRSYSYVYGKPLHYFFYVVVAALLGALCWAVVAGAEAIVEGFGFWALARGGTWEHVAPIQQAARQFAAGLPADAGQTWAFSLGTALIGMVLAALHAAVSAFRFTYFFVAASAIYLLLRQDVDAKEMDEVWLDEPNPPAVTTVPASAAAAAEATAPAADRADPHVP